MPAMGTMRSATLLQPRHCRSGRADRRLATATLPKRILIDCTATLRHDCGTGVQRVVRNLVHWSPSAGDELDIACHGVAYDAASGFRTVDTLTGVAHGTRDACDRQVVMPALASGGLPAIRHSVKRTLSVTGLIAPARRIRQAVRHGLGSARDAIERLRPRPAPTKIGAGDVLFLPDTIWLTPQVWDGARQAATRGAKLGAMVYDLIPLRFAELYGDEFASIFRQWLDNVLGLADFVVCISRSSWEDLQRYVAAHDARHARRRRLVGGWFRLGEGLDASSDRRDVRPTLRGLFAGQPMSNPYLVVGSFDPRKDLPTVVKAFERLWAQGEKVRLVSIGRSVPGHRSPLEQFVLDHSEHGRRLFFFGDVGDWELDFCYRNSAALITASYAEGFNLPIVESLGRGRPVLASDIPVHREVAGARAAYFAPRDPDALAGLVRRYQSGQQPEMFLHLDGFCWPNWRESSRELLERIIEFYPDTAASAREIAA